VEFSGKRPLTNATRSRISTIACAPKDFILSPAKLTQVETFRVGCIGAIGPDEVHHTVNAVRDKLSEMGMTEIAPKVARCAAP